uniref:Uncharacterized protein n=1 Tax=Glossina pallidipes TaxID=7398 RepID=A0A1A9ZM71_GLOPL
MMDGESRPLLRYGRRDKIFKTFPPMDLTFKSTLGAIFFVMVIASSRSGEPLPSSPSATSQNK